MREQDHQKKITEYLEKRGYYVINLISTSKPGIPDLLAIPHYSYGTEPLWIEVKKPSGVLAKLQEFVIGILKKNHHQRVIVAYGYEDFINKYQQ